MSDKCPKCGAELTSATDTLEYWECGTTRQKQGTELVLFRGFKCLHNHVAALKAIVDKLPERLASYEMDEPHWDQEDNYYPPVQLAEWLAAEHHGDCTNECNACMRCYGEHIKHKAAFLLRPAEAAEAAKEKT